MQHKRSKKKKEMQPAQNNKVSVVINNSHISVMDFDKQPKDCSKEYAKENILPVLVYVTV